MFYKIINVSVIAPYKILVIFKNGVKKIYDVKELINKYENFKNLNNNSELFKEVKVDAGGYGISWNDDIDISCNELWDNGVDITDTKICVVREDNATYNCDDKKE